MIDRAPLWVLAQMSGALVTFLLFLTTAATGTTLIAALWTLAVMALRTLRLTPAKSSLPPRAVSDLEQMRRGTTCRAVSSPPTQEGWLG